MAKRTKAEAQVTRENILAAAADVFDAKGVAGASLAQIADQASVTRGAIYWHFRNKMEIFAALQEQMHQSIIEIVLADLENDHPRPLQQLQELCVKLLTDLETDSQKRKTISIFFLKCDYSGKMEVFLRRQQDNKQKNIELFERYLDRAKRKGHLRPEADSRVLTLSLLFYLTGTVYEYLRGPSLFSLAEVAPALMNQFFQGITSPS
ncbi:MAG: TetR family transcriptional regulator [Pseudohongiellaceae bacterium]